MLSISSLGRACMAGAALIFANAVAASTVSFSDTALLHGKESLALIELPFDMPGTYSVKASPIEWIGKPEQLTIGVFTATEPIKTLSAAGTIEFFKAGAEKVFIQIYARSAVTNYAGLVGISADCTVVPLPPSGWLLGGSLSGLALWRSLVPGRRKKKACAPAGEAEGSLNLWRLAAFIACVAFVWLATASWDCLAAMFRRRPPVAGDRAATAWGGGVHVAVYDSGITGMGTV